MWEGGTKDDMQSTIRISHVLFATLVCSLLEPLDGICNQHRILLRFISGCMCDDVTNTIPFSPNEDFGKTKLNLGHEQSNESIENPHFILCSSRFNTHGPC